MKTKELIRRLQEADPSGELPCCVENIDILCVLTQQAYWDGSLQVLVRDPNDSDAVTGGEFRRCGLKVTLHTWSLYELISDFPDIPITYDSPSAEDHDRERVEQYREEIREEDRRLAAQGQGV